MPMDFIPTTSDPFMEYSSSSSLNVQAPYLPNPQEYNPQMFNSQQETFYTMPRTQSMYQPVPQPQFQEYPQMNIQRPTNRTTGDQTTIPLQLPSLLREFSPFQNWPLILEHWKRKRQQIQDKEIIYIFFCNINFSNVHCYILLFSQLSVFFTFTVVYTIGRNVRWKNGDDFPLAWDKIQSGVRSRKTTNPLEQTQGYEIFDMLNE